MRKPARMLATLALIILAAPLAAEAQKLYRIGWLDYTSFGFSASAFTQALGARGWVKGKTFAIEYRGGNGRLDLLAEVAAELVRLPVDIIVAPGTPEALAAKKATSTLPIVMVGVDDPVESGLVTNLARPAGNVTGLTNLHAELSAKLLALLKEAVPRATRVAFLWEPAHPGSRLQLKHLRMAAQALNVSLQSLEVRHHTDVEPAFATMRSSTARL